MSLRKPGYIRIKLAEMLVAQGYEVEPDDLWSAEGHYRIYGNQEESLRWEAFERGADYAHQRHLISFSTMTECVRKGFDLNHDHGNTWWVDSHGR